MKQQLEKLQALIREVRPTNRFYAAKLPPELPASLAEFFERTPFTTKHELALDQQLHPPFGTNLSYPMERYSRFSQTSGTSGKPMRWLDTAESWDWMAGNWVRVFEAAGVTGADRLFTLFLSARFWDSGSLLKLLRAWGASACRAAECQRRRGWR